MTQSKAFCSGTRQVQPSGRRYRASRKAETWKLFGPLPTVEHHIRPV